jgi:septum formation protein
VKAREHPLHPLTDAEPLWLGSSSPRRREILENLRVPFRVAAGAPDERVHLGETPEAYLARVVLAKLAAVRAIVAADPRARPGDVVLVADTSVVLGDTILGKPIDEGGGDRARGIVSARAMVAALAGRTHRVLTRFALALAQAQAGGGPDAAVLHSETVDTRVTFRPLSDGVLTAYAESGEGLDKAGGYAVQGLGAALVARIEGSYSNVVGLPACEVVVALEALGLVARA